MPTSLREIITRQHPTYTATANEWLYYADAYAGGPTWAQKTNPLAGSMLGNADMSRYISRYELEDSVVYGARLSRAAYVNLCAAGVDLLTGTVGSADTVQKEVPSSYSDLWDNADLTGADFLRFMADARCKAAIYGASFILVDSTRAAGPVVTEADVQRFGIRPYLRLLTPLQVINYRLDANGTPIEVMLKLAVAPAGSILDGPSDPVVEYRYWSAAEWRVYREQDKDIVLVDQGANAVKRVPLVALYHRQVSPFVGESLIKESSRFSHLASNWLSQLDSVQRLQCFSQACLRSENEPKQVGLGESTILHLHPSKKNEAGDVIGEADFFYRTSESAPLEVMWKGLGQLVQMSQQSMSLQPDSTTATGTTTAESGISRAWKWHQTERKLVSMAQNEQSAANQIWNLMAAWRGDESFKGTITYGTSFDLTSLDDDIQKMLSLQAAGIPPAANRELLRAAISKSLPNLPADTQKLIAAELDRLGVAQVKLDALAKA